MGMNWTRIAQALTLPILVAAPIAWICWAKRWLLAATILGSAVFFIGFIVFAGMEYYEAVSYRVWCETTNTPCRPSSPSDFTRIVAYGGIAMLQTMTLYLFSDTIERRIRDRDMDPSWRR
jgi:hypothetical protein